MAGDRLLSYATAEFLAQLLVVTGALFGLYLICEWIVAYIFRKFF